MSFARELDTARRLGLAAGAVARRHQTGGIAVRSKANGEVVTAADLEVDRIVVAGLTRAFPGDALYSEESPDSGSRRESRRVWIVDPIDSTSNFAAGGDEYSVSIGLAVDGTPVVGVVYNPARDELIAGVVGAGVTLNGSPVRVSAARDIAAARITVSGKEWSRGLTRLAGGQVVLTPVASMAYKLGRVAAGLDDGVVSVKPRKEWGTCAGVALVTASGGRACLLDGRRICFNRAEQRQEVGMVAAGPGLIDVLRAAAVDAERERQ